MAPALRVAAAAAALTAAGAQGTPTTVTVNWAQVVRPLKTSPGFQTVVNPLTTRESPVHDAVYGSIASLGASYQRYVPWVPYPKLGIAELEPPSTGNAVCGFVNSGGPGNPWTTTIDCASRGGGTIAAVTFADYGGPTGFCGALVSNASCTSPTAKAAVAAACVGRPSCTLTSNDETFGPAPCGAAHAVLAVQVACATPVPVATYWDFRLLDEGMADFLAAAGNRCVRGREQHAGGGASGAEMHLFQRVTGRAPLGDRGRLRLAATGARTPSRITLFPVPPTPSPFSLTLQLPDPQLLDDPQLAVCGHAARAVPGRPAGRDLEL